MRRFVRITAFLVLVGGFMLTAGQARAQLNEPPAAHYSDELSLASSLTKDADTANNYLAIGKERLWQEQTAMMILLSWGLGSIAGGAALGYANKDYRDFALMNAGWGTVNAGIAALALTNADAYSATTTLQTILQDEQFFNRILAINSGLNVAYVSVGFSMNYLGQSSRTRQFGSAVMVQGAFLMAFDAWLLWNSSDRLDRLSFFPAQIEVSSIGHAGTTAIQGLGLSIGF
jgi:hypothetical protein